jgi:hypothetical protein
MDSFQKQCNDAADGLEQLARVIAGSLEEAVAEAAEILVEEGKRQVPKRSGLLRERIQHKPYKTLRNEAVEMVFVNSRYAHLIEYGHAAPSRLITPRVGKALKTTADGYAASSAGGAAAAKPFMRPALDSTRDEMARRVAVVTIRRVKGRATSVKGIVR